jgi:hypothetical protein
MTSRLDDVWVRRLGNTNTWELAPADSAIALDDTAFFLEDPVDPTKRVRFDAEGVTTATTRVISVPDFDFTLGSGVGALRSVVSNAAAVFATPTVLTSAMSGTIQLMNVATGIDFTLPVISTATIGMTFGFRLIVEPTSNSYRISAGEATDLYVGHVWLTDKDAATADANALIGQFRPDLSNDVILTITGTDDTQGSLVGGYLNFEALTATRWHVSGTLIGDGSLATIFS